MPPPGRLYLSALLQRVKLALLVLGLDLIDVLGVIGQLLTRAVVQTQPRLLQYVTAQERCVALLQSKAQLRICVQCCLFSAEAHKLRELERLSTAL